MVHDFQNYKIKIRTKMNYNEVQFPQNEQSSKFSRIFSILWCITSKGILEISLELLIN